MAYFHVLETKLIETRFSTFSYTLIDVLRADQIYFLRSLKCEGFFHVHVGISLRKYLKVIEYISIEYKAKIIFAVEIYDLG